VWRERLGFYARLKDAKGMMAYAFDIATELAEEGRGDGKDTGLLGNVRAILGELGLGEYWGRSLSPKKRGWKKIVKEAVARWEERERERWRRRQEMSAQWGMAMACATKASPLLRMRGEDRTLLAGIRMMMTREELGIDERGDGACGLCGAKHMQGIMHLVTSCEKMKKIRRTALHKEYWGKSNRQKWGVLIKGGERNMTYLREMARIYKRDTGNSLIPWVGTLGSRHKEGLVGMSVLVQQVSEWVEKGKD
jgi:hypothetical protein